MLSFDRLPVTGPCVAYRPPGHAPHVLDLVGVAESSHRLADVPLWRALGSLGVERFHGWRREIVAPAAGAVVAMHDGVLDRRALRLLRDVPTVFIVTPLRAGRDLPKVAGNHVVLEVDGGFVLLAHLRSGSIVVDVGETVATIDTLGEVGNSGNSLLPHVHLQAMSDPDPFVSDVLSWQVSSLDRHVAGVWEPAPGPLPRRVPIRSN